MTGSVEARPVECFGVAPVADDHRNAPPTKPIERLILPVDLDRDHATTGIAEFCGQLRSTVTHPTHHNVATFSTKPPFLNLLSEDRRQRCHECCCRSSRCCQPSDLELPRCSGLWHAARLQREELQAQVDEIGP